MGSVSLDVSLQWPRAERPGLPLFRNVTTASRSPPPARIDRACHEWPDHPLAQGGEPASRARARVGHATTPRVRRADSPRARGLSVSTASLHVGRVLGRRRTVRDLRLYPPPSPQVGRPWPCARPAPPC